LAKYDPEKIKEYQRSYYISNKEKLKARIRAREIRLRDELRPYHAARRMQRIAREKQATPSWADSKAIRAFYVESARRSADTGVQHHVDHIVPLQGKTVCGLHVENNLQVMPGGENQSKGNRWWPDCWE
jgi:hypothetical protein